MAKIYIIYLVECEVISVPDCPETKSTRSVGSKRIHPERTRST